MADSIAQSPGVDISKDTLDVHLQPAGRARRFANTEKGCRALIGWLGGVVVVRVAFEPTGAYHHRFERLLAQAGFALCKVNPRQARRFAEAIGRQAKTDAVDAAMLARLAPLLEPPARPVISARLDEMKELHIARSALVKDRTAALNREHTRRSALLRRQAAQRLAQIERQIAAIDAALRHLLMADAELKARRESRRGLPGLSEPRALWSRKEMPGRGGLDPTCAGSLAGLAPTRRPSAQRRGKRPSRGGRATGRRPIYRPPLLARRSSPCRT